MMRAFLKLYNELFVYNPVAMILTTAVMLWICAPVYLYIIVKFIALIKFFKGKVTETTDYRVSARNRKRMGKPYITKANS